MLSIEKSKPLHEVTCPWNSTHKLVQFLKEITSGNIWSQFGNNFLPRKQFFKAYTYRSETIRKYDMSLGVWTRRTGRNKDMNLLFVFK